jgi:hypothetical protein
MMTGEPEYRALRLGFYVWLASYAWLAVGAAVIWRRRHADSISLKPIWSPRFPRNHLRQAGSPFRHATA